MIEGEKQTSRNPLQIARGNEVITVRQGGELDYISAQHIGSTVQPGEDVKIDKLREKLVVQANKLYDALNSPARKA